MKLIIRWIVSGLALFLAAYVIPGIRVEDPNAWMIYGAMAVILGLVNALLRPFLKLLTCPLIILTLGLFSLLINGVTFLLAARIAQALGVGFYVNTFWDAFWGALIVSALSVFFSLTIRDEK